LSAADRTIMFAAVEAVPEPASPCVVAAAVVAARALSRQRRRGYARE
jgi:hypothetical protein